MTSKVRRASLRVAHARSCPNANLSALSSVGKGSGCTCPPRYFTFYRGLDGKPVKGERVSNRQVADRALRKLQVQLDEGAADVDRPDARSFRQWAATFTGEVAPGRGVKGSSLRAYEVTVRIADDVFGSTALRSIGQAELRRFVAAIREPRARGRNQAGAESEPHRSGDATVAKHLRQLSAVLQAAEDEGLIARNPVPKFKKGLRLRVPKGDEAFTDVELAKLWASIQKREKQPVYLAMCKTAVTTGARQGELVAADVDDLSLLEGKLEIRRHWDRTDGATLPKDSEPRTVHLTAPARAVLEKWLTVRGMEPGPLFPAPRGERINGQYLTKLVSAAMVGAGIPKAAANGRDRKPFHALRATFTRLALEQGRNPQWVQDELGHSSADLTLNVYGRWSDEAKAAEAGKVTAESFPV